MIQYKKKNKKGSFIIIDGIDGSGKTTQIELLSIALKSEGYDVEVFDFPQYGQKSAGPIEEYLSGKYDNVNSYVGSLFFAVDRYDASFKIRKLLDDGTMILCNRYVTSNAGHQGGKIDNKTERVKYFKWLNNLEYEIFGIPKPELNIVLHVEPKIAWKLAGNKYKGSRVFTNGHERDLHEKDMDHLKRAERVFLEIAEVFANTELVECMEKGKLIKPQEVHKKIWDLVKARIIKEKN